MRLFQEIPLYAALVGSTIAGYIDLRTTEIPDEIPLAMVIFGVFWGCLAFLAQGDVLLLRGLLVGGILFATGFLMYYTGQWGGGDAKLLAAIGLLVPEAPLFAMVTLLPFALAFLLNVFMLGALYIVVYAFAISLPNARVTSAFLADVRGGLKNIGLFALVLLIALMGSLKLFGATLTPQYILLAAALVPGGIGLYLLWRFLRIVERVGFQKKVKTKELRVGDMLGEDVPELKMSKKLIRGLEEDEIKQIRRERREIWIREGVRFGPVFVLALLYTMFVGDFFTVFFLI